MKTYKLNEFATKIGVSVSTLQKWDKKGVLVAHRTPTNRRFYTDEHLQIYLGFKIEVAAYVENLRANCPASIVLCKPNARYVLHRCTFSGYDIVVSGINNPNETAIIEVIRTSTRYKRDIVETIIGIPHEQLPKVWRDVEKKYTGREVRIK